MAGTWKTCRTLSITVLIVLTNPPAGNSYIVYPNDATSERSLPFCNNLRTACNIIHKRFWMTPLVKRLCKCPNFSDCPKQWSTETDDTIMLNGRAQMKFCGQIRNLPDCNAEEIATSIESYNSTNAGPVYNIEVNCYCPNWHYFKKQHTSTSRNNDGNAVRKDYYRCQPIQACAGGEFCGHITTDLYETYYKCSCPRKYICIMKDRKTMYTTEALYEGSAYRGICTYYEP